MPATASLNLSAVASYSQASGFTTFTGNPKIESSLSYTTGDVDKVFTASGTISTGTTVDLTNATDPFGTSLNFSTVKGLAVNNTHASAELVLGGGGNALLGSDSYTVKAGKALIVSSPFAVDGTHKNLLITPSASCSYQLVIFGD